MTMVNTALTNTTTPNRGGVSLRKTNKPLMEKRRRARINDSLTQLKSLVIHSSKKDSSQFSKLEKADILELTVKHLRGLQAQQQQQQLQQQHHHHLSAQQQQQQQQTASNVPSESLINGKYRAGFEECANEVIRYLDQSQGLNQDSKSKVVLHLSNCLQLVSNHSHNNINQSKISPQPMSHSHAQATIVQPQLQPQSQPPNNAAAILAAAAAAANNSTTTTTQLPNGQIIQIVSNPLQNVHSAAPSSQNVLGLNPASTQCSAPTVAQQPSAPKPHPSHQQSTNNNLSAAQPAYIHYAQPLHIQIPPIVSPVLIQKKSQQHHQQQHQQIKQQIEMRESTNNFSLSSSSSSSSHSSTSSFSSLPDQVNDIVSSSTTLPSPPPPTQRVSTSPPSSLYPGHPKARAQKQLNFFAQELNKSSSTDKFDKFSNSRIPKHPLTPPSSSGSSSESENTSPLNLSQSPPFSASHLRSENRRPYNLFPTDSHSHHKIHDQSQHQHSKTSTSLLGENLALRDGNNNNSHNISSSFAPNATSVIVNSRKCSDFIDGRYWSMMECARQQNTPSPASSMGEERVWRPW